MIDCPIKFYFTHGIDQNQVDASKAFQLVRRAGRHIWLERDLDTNPGPYFGDDTTPAFGPTIK